MQTKDRMPYLPEGNPVEQVFERIRRYVEEQVNGRIEVKGAAV